MIFEYLYCLMKRRKERFLSMKNLGKHDFGDFPNEILRADNSRLFHWEV